MRHGVLKNWKVIVWYGWVIGGALIVGNASISYVIGLEGIPGLWGG